MAIACLAWALPCRPAEPVTALLGCRAIADAAARLACFDREAAALERSAAASTPVAAAASPPAPQLSPQQQFGLTERTVVAHEVASGTRAADAAKIEAHIARLATAGDGRTVFTLDNEQVWRQLQAEGSLLARQGDAVTISRGALGSFWLQLANGRGCKVSRLH